MVEKPLDPAETPINEITEFMKTCFDRKVRNKEIQPYAMGEYQAILNQQVTKRRNEFLRRGRSRSRSPPVPRKRRNRKRSKSPRDMSKRSHRSSWRDERHEKGQAG